jgi:signal transduction histidine kinase/CheY-like chemotaxis protein
METGVLSSVPATRGEERVALAVVLGSLAILAVLAPFAKRPLEPIPPFIPLYQSALVMVDIVTAALLFAQCRASRSRSLFVLACGYLFTAVMTLAHTLSFPGLFAAQGVLGGGAQSTAWIYMLWHAGFPLFVVGYALSSPRALARGGAVAGVAGTLVLAIAAAALATQGERLLPAIMDGHGYRPAYRAVVGLVWLCSLGALACLWRKRPRTVLDLWIMVVMCVWLCEIALAAMLNAGRFDLGFYAGRIYGLAAASFVLFALIFETIGLHARLEAAAGANAARAEAEAATRAKDQFLAMLGHELRNPLAPIVAALQIMRLRDPNALAAERLVIERQVRHLTRLVDDLLDVARLARGRLELRLVRCEAGDIVARAVEMAGPLLESRRQRLVVDVPPGLALDADGDRLAQALCNLLANAAKFTPSGGRITVRGAPREGAIVLTVRDDGPGLPPEMRGRLFQPFAQGAQTIERPQGGLGLGLAIVREIVVLHGGTIEAHSDGAGQGTEFVLRLPAAKAAVAPPAAEPESAVAGSRAHRPVRVLIVDDNVDAAAMVAEVLRLSGADIRIAHEPAEALALAERFKPQAALLDLGLPGMDGFELARRLRALPGLADLRLAAITGYGQDSDRARTTAAGFAAHLVKPASAAQLFGFLRAVEASERAPS